MGLLDSGLQPPPRDGFPLRVDDQLRPPRHAGSRVPNELRLQLVPGRHDPLPQYPQIVRVGLDLDLQ